jgi:membrane protein
MAEESDSKLKKIASRAQAFLEDPGAVLQAGTEGSRWRRFLHFCWMTGDNFVRNRCPVRAAALAYTTILALVPVLAVVVSISTSLIKGKSEQLADQWINRIVEIVAPQSNLGPDGKVLSPDQARSELAAKISDYIKNIRTGTLGVTGMISLILVGILLLSNIETTFNDIWGVTQGRGWFARIINYWAAITLGPVVILASQGVTATGQFAATAHWLGSLPMVGKWVTDFLPLIILIPGFALFYIFMPNTRVHWLSALVGGAVAGVLWQLNTIFSMIYVSNAVSYSKIYGSLGMLPLFLVGLYYSWLMLLLGAQVAYSFQNRQAYLQAKLAEGINQQGREYIALRLMTYTAHCFQCGDKPPTLTQFSTILGVSMRLLSQILQALLTAGLLVEVTGAETAYALARPANRITYHEILQTLRTCQGQELATNEGLEQAAVRQEFDRIRQAEKMAAEAISLQAMVEQLDRNQGPTKE